MDLLLSIDVFKKYFDCRSKFPKSDLEQSIISLFENEKNRFIVSKALINKIEESVKGNPVAEAFLQPFIAHIIQTQAINIGASGDANDIDKVLTSMDVNYINSTKEKKDLYIDISLTETQSLKKNDSVIIEKVSKPNHHWVLFNLACYHPLSVTLRYSDFSSDQQVIQAFKLLLTKVQNLSVVDIYDKQVNLDHKLFDAVKGKVLVHYYTGLERRITDDIDKTDNLKKGLKKVKVFKAGSKHIHERKIVANSLLIECDDDFWNLKVDRPTWKVDFTYCSTAASKIGEKKKHFKICKFMYSK